MTLIACPECGRQISSAAAACPQCGHPSPLPYATPRTPAAPPPTGFDAGRDRRQRGVFLAAMAVIVSVAAALIGFGTGNPAVGWAGQIALGFGIVWFAAASSRVT